jgi:hypothetical protein
VGDGRYDEHYEIGIDLLDSSLKQGVIAMSDKPKVNWQIPCLPIFFQVSTIPPIHIKASITELNDL